jgi:hypothetical protein
MLNKVIALGQPRKQANQRYPCRRFPFVPFTKLPNVWKLASPEGQDKGREGEESAPGLSFRGPRNSQAGLAPAPRLCPLKDQGAKAPAPTGSCPPDLGTNLGLSGEEG